MDPQNLLESSAASTSTPATYSTSPSIRRNRPRHDSTPLDSSITNQQSTSLNHRSRSRTESVPESNRTANSTTDSILPQRGNDSDAESALSKLDRMAKAHEMRRKWRTRTGVAGLVGDHRERERRRREREEEQASSSDESIDLSRAFEEVRLKISSLPDHPVLGRVRGAVSNARDLLGSRNESSPRASHEPPSSSTRRRGSIVGETEAAGETSFSGGRTASLRRWARGSNSKHPTPSFRNSPSPGPDSILGGEKLLSPPQDIINGDSSTNGNGILRRNSDSSSPVGGGPASEDHQRSSVEIQEPIQRARSAGVAQITDLGAVNEETVDVEEDGVKREEDRNRNQVQHQGEVESSLRPTISRNSTSSDPAHATGVPPTLLNPKPERAPFLNITSPSDASLTSHQVDSLQSPSTSASPLSRRPISGVGMTNGDSSSSGLSFLSEDEGHRVHDEPEDHSITTSNLKHPPPPPREMTHSPLSHQAFSSDEGEAFEDSSDTSDDEGDDTDDANAALASIVLNHGDSALTKKEQKRARKAEKAASRAASRASTRKGKDSGAAGGTQTGTLERSGTYIEPFNWTGSGADVTGNNSGALIDSNGHRRTHSIGQHVSKGLNYASSQSRNRRAMEKYSPNPNRALSGSKSPQISRPASPGVNGLQPPVSISGQLTPSTVGGGGSISRPVSAQGGLASERGSLDRSRRNSINELEAAQYALSNGTGLEATHSASPLSEMEVNQHQHPLPSADSPVSLTDLGTNFLQRWNTNQSLASSVGGGTITSTRRRFGLNAPKFLSRRRANTMGTEAADLEDDRTPKTEDVEKELDAILGKLTAEESPEDAKEKFEYDVMYENQRGLLVFGIPKFSSRTLFQWDPSPWTNSANENLSYNIVSAQLPDPSWEWVHPEWLIDMSGDTDESGWQYSANFGHGPFRTASTLALKGISKPLPRAGQAGNEKMNQRLEEKLEKRENKEQTRDDHGLESLKRNTRYRQPKWKGAGDPWTFVRRRRWIRMRMRKALAPSTHKSQVKHPSGTSTPIDPSRQQPLDQKQSASSNRSPNGLHSTGSSSDSMHESDEDSSNSSALSLSDDDSEDWAAADANRSAFLPRELPGGLSNGKPGDPSAALHLKEGSELERRKRHAREFTGTLRELKSLLPAILDKKHHKYSAAFLLRKDDESRLAVAEWWRAELDARNPFISWKFVSKRLEDPDLAFASSSLRAREKKFEKRQSRRQHNKMPSSFRQEEESTTSKPNRRFSGNFQSGTISSQPSPSLTKDALIELNFRRVLRVMRACKVDRQKLELWRLWLGAQTVESVTKEEPWGGRGGWAEDFSSINNQAGQKAINAAKSKWKATFIQADAMDVWDVLERRLDQVLLLFEFQASRVSLIRLLLTVHATSHPHHHFRPSSRQSRASPRLENNKESNPESLDFGSNPPELSPTHRHGQDGELDEAGGKTIQSQDWKRSALPRLEFWSDLEACARSLVESNPSHSSPNPNLHQDSTEEKSTVVNNFKSFALEPTSSSSLQRSQQDEAFLHELLQIPNVNRRRDWVRASSSSEASSQNRAGGIREDELK